MSENGQNTPRYGWLGLKRLQDEKCLSPTFSWQPSRCREADAKIPWP